MTVWWPWQRDEIEHQHSVPARALLWEPRTGKTLTTVECMKRTGLKRFLVVAPSLAGTTTWPDTIAEVWPDANVTMLVGGSIKKRGVQLTALGEALLLEDRRPDVVIINYEAVSFLIEELLRWKPQGVIADEMHLIRSAGAKRTRALVRLGDKSEWRRGLTGTPTPRDYSNIYAQYRYLDPTVFGTNQATFRERYIVFDPIWPNRVRGYRRVEELQDKMHSIASVIRRRDAFGKDGVQPPITQKVLLPDAARKMYERLAREYVFEMEDGKTVSVSHKLSRLNSLQQLASGFIYESGKARWVHQAKLDALLEELENYMDSGRSAIIFYRFDAEGKEIDQRLLLRSLSLARISGRSSLNERTEAVKRLGKDIQFLIIQEQAGSLGIDLSAADTAIFFSHSFDYATHIQARDRIWKPGLTSRLFIYLESVGTVDHFARQVIEMKEKASNLLLTPGSFAKAVTGDT